MFLPLFQLKALPAPLLLLLSATICPAVQAIESASATSSGLIIEHTRNVTCTRPTQNGDIISVHYKGTLQSNGNEFDESYKRGAPFTFKLGAHRVIKGWDEGLLGMCIGEARKLTIPPELGYGHTGAGTIPPESTLVFETELMAIKGVVVAPTTTISTVPTTSTSVSPSIASSISSAMGDAISSATSTPKPSQGAEAGPKHGQAGAENGECRLLGPFALVVQGALGALALLVLVLKRWRERPRRPVKIWFFDASKQVVGSILLHLANLFMSMLSSGDFDAASQVQEIATALQDDQGRRPNPCSFYLLNLAIDVCSPQVIV